MVILPYYMINCQGFLPDESKDGLDCPLKAT